MHFSFDLSTIFSASAWPLDEVGLSGSKPCAAFQRLESPEEWLWLDCASGSNDAMAWSYLAAYPFLKVEIQSRRTLIQAQNGTIQVLPLGGLEGLRMVLGLISAPRPSAPGAPPFCGGWVGWLGYDFISNVSPEQGSGIDCLGAFCYFDAMLAFEHARGRWWATTHDHSSGSARGKLERMFAQFAPPGNSRILDGDSGRFHSNLDQRSYEGIVSKALQHIAAGDIYQVNLAQRFSAQWSHGAAALYLRLRRESPARFGAFLPASLFGVLDTHRSVLSVSPELFLRVRGGGGEVLTCPIKGTRPLPPGANPARVARELDASAKERAELNMIVDLLRNDLGRVCRYGSVSVLSAGATQILPTLVHRVASVRGVLRPEITPCDLLEAAFPGGSVTGTPKLHAMRIINELEAVPRGPYCGAIGWIAPGGDMELSIAIRTAVLDDAAQRVDYHAGSGIVADSDPCAEFEETQHKARAFFRAIGASEP